LKKKKPRFFCDNCGCEVGSDVKSCPSCGRFFASVRCPACGFSGEDRLFTRGCPSCGYSTPPAVKKPKFKPSDSQKLPAQPLPIWAYIISILALLLVIALLSHIITL
jgi:hypothetical protein